MAITIIALIVNMRNFKPSFKTKRNAWTPSRRKLFKYQFKYYFTLTLLVLVMYGMYTNYVDTAPEFLSPVASTTVRIVEVEKPVYIYPIEQHIAHYAEVYGVRQELMHCIMAHEGGYKPGTNEYNWEATNPNSSATGAAQFIAGTWVSIRTKMGEDPSLELRTDPHETVKTLAWALGNGYKHHWQVVTPLNLCN